jgi:hypothetical protein
LQVILLLLLWFGCTTNQGSIPLLLQLVQGPLFVLSGVFVAEEVDGVGDRGSGDTTRSVVQTHIEDFMSMALRSACFIDE